ncbi:MAG: MotA/TolQ/ExbB proton channel family protein [Planctomycetes bacterium]|nr:MotA/TolQ/ExbB proton channel family protein [Planctomycetota bacterium]
MQKQTTQTNAFDHFVTEGGVITYVILLPLSMVTIGLCVDHLVHIRRGTLLPDARKLRLGELIEQRKYKEVLETTSADPSLLGTVLHAGLSQANSGLPVMERAMEEVMETRAASLYRRIEYLNIIGNVSPMIGLFGTVYGMIRTFSTIVEQGGSPDPAALAGGISIALVTTFWGLLVAIPALSVFHLMRNRIDGLLAECAVEAEGIIQFFKPLARGTVRAVREAPQRPAAGVAKSAPAVTGRPQS